MSDPTGEHQDLRSLLNLWLRPGPLHDLSSTPIAGRGVWKISARRSNDDTQGWYIALLPMVWILQLGSDRLHCSANSGCLHAEAGLTLSSVLIDPPAVLGHQFTDMRNPGTASLSWLPRSCSHCPNLFFSDRNSTSKWWPDIGSHWISMICDTDRTNRRKRYPPT